jgi:hypothetical protein
VNEWGVDGFVEWTLRVGVVNFGCR